MGKAKGTPFTEEDVRRMQSNEAKKNGGVIPPGSFVRKVQSIIAKREAEAKRR